MKDFLVFCVLQFLIALQWRKRRAAINWRGAVLLAVGS
jgi:hypothetical protein